jgi:thioesterase domain-containing protein
MSTNPRIATLTPGQAELLGLLLDEMAGPAPQGSCLPERAVVRETAGEITLVVIHGAGGATLFLHQLSRHLSPGHGLVGINADFANDSTAPAPQDVGGLIGRYVEAVRTGGQPGAPLHLAGYSSGCLIALEVARRIEASGDRVASLTLIDPARLPASEAFRQDRRSPQELLARRFETARLAGITPVSSLYPTVARIQEVISAIAAIVRADPVAAPIHLLRATQGREALPAAEIARWAARTSSGLFMSEVAADHAGIIAEPGITAAGAAIMKWFVDPHSLELV